MTAGFTPAARRRSTAYHRPLFAAELVATVVAWVLFVVFAAVVGPGADVDTVPRGLRLGALAAVASLPGGLLLNWWRELWHEPRHGPPFEPPVPRRRNGSPLPTPAPGAPTSERSGVAGASTAWGVAAVVALDRVVTALVIGAVVASVVVLGSAWAASPPVVAFAVVPLTACIVAPVVAAVGGTYRRRVDRTGPVDRRWARQLDELWALAAQRTAMPPVQWWAAGGRLQLSGERAWVRPGRRAVHIVLDRGLLEGGNPIDATLDDPGVAGWPALAVAAHELGHARTIPYGLGAVGRQAAIAGVGAVGLAVVGRLAVDAGGIGAVHLAVASVCTVATAPLIAARSRLEERTADDFSASLLDGRRLVPVVRRLLIDAGVDLEPGRLRRLLGDHPAPSERLERLERAGRDAAGRGPFTAPSANPWWARRKVLR